MLPVARKVIRPSAPMVKRPFAITSVSPSTGNPARPARSRTSWMFSGCVPPASIVTRPLARSALTRPIPRRPRIDSSTPRVQSGQTMPRTGKLRPTISAEAGGDPIARTASAPRSTDRIANRPA